MRDDIALICTAPKAGTYLGANLLIELGLEFSRLHIGDSRTMLVKSPDQLVIDFQLPADVMVGNNRAVDVSSLAALEMLHDGCFAVSHLPPHMIDPSIWKRLKVLHIVRSPREMLQSLFHYLRESRPYPVNSQWQEIFSSQDDDRRKMLRLLELELPYQCRLWRDLLNWSYVSFAITVCYSDLISVKPNVVVAIARHFGVFITPEEAAERLVAALSKSSPTKSQLDSRDREHIWSQECEETYRRFGAHFYEAWISTLGHVDKLDSQIL